MHAFAASHAPFGVRPLTPRLGAEISGVDLARGIAPDDFRALYDAFLRYQVLVFPPHELPPARAGRVRAPVRRGAGARDDDVPRRRLPRAVPALEPRRERQARRQAPRQGDARTGTPTARGGASPARRRSSTARSSPRPAARPTSATCTAPTNGSSDAWKRRIAGLRAVHNLDFSRTRRHGVDLMTEAQKREAPPVEHPIVRRHPETGRTCLYLGDHAESIVGMPYDEGRALIEELNALAVHPDLTYEHHWQPHELIVWDNRCLMHRATGYDPRTAVARRAPMHRARRRAGRRRRRLTRRGRRPLQLSSHAGRPNGAPARARFADNCARC